MTVEAIFIEALALPADQRAKLAEQLRHSLPATEEQPTGVPKIGRGQGMLVEYIDDEEPQGPLAVGDSSDEAVVNLRALAAARLSNRTTIIDPPVTQRPSPVPVLPLSENPLWPAFLAAIEENRRTSDQEDQALYATEE